MGKTHSIYLADVVGFQIVASCRPFVPWTACAGCWNGEDPKRIVICEGCEVEYHTYCLSPPLDEVWKV